MSRSEFIDLFNTKFQNKSDEPEAKKSLAAIKEKCTYSQIDIGSYMMRSNSEKSEKINLRSFKIAINDLKCLTLYQIENLAKYMDVDNEGFISINNFVASVHHSGALPRDADSTSPWAAPRRATLCAARMRTPERTSGIEHAF